MHRASRRRTGFTLVELMVSLVIVVFLASLVTPMVITAIKREKEQELRTALRQIRQAIDDYKQAGDEGRIARLPGQTGYPRSLAALVTGAPDALDPQGRRLYFLRRIPRDPFFTDERVSGRGYLGQAQLRLGARQTRGRRRRVRRLSAVRRHGPQRRALPAMVNARRGRSGFVLIGVVFLTFVVSLTLVALARLWEADAQRDKERELLWSGRQLGKALASYALATPEGESALPRSLDQLRAGCARRSAAAPSAQAAARSDDGQVRLGHGAFRRRRDHGRAFHFAHEAARVRRIVARGAGVREREGNTRNGYSGRLRRPRRCDC